MELTFVHYASLIVVLLLSFVPGWYAARNVKSAEDYNVGGRSSGVPLVAGTLIGTLLGGASTIGTAQLAYDFGFCAWWFTLSEGVALLVMAAFYARPLRISGLTTISEFMVAAYGRLAGPLTSVAATMGIFFSIVASSLTAIHLFRGLFHFNHFVTALLILFIVLAYVFFGGINSSGMAGIFKCALIFCTLFVAGVGAFINMGGWEGWHASFPAFPWFSMFGRGVESGFYSLFSVVVGVVSTQTYIQALFAAKDARTATLGCVTGAAIIIPVGIPAIMIGFFMRINHPGIAPIDALPLYLINYLPPWLGGAALTGLILSSIGSIAGLALGCGTMISKDIFGGVFGIHDSRRLLWINRFAVLVISALALTFVMYNLDSYVLHWNYLSMSLRGAGIFLPLTFAILFRGRLSHAWGVSAMVAGIFVALTWNYFVPTAQHTLFQGLFFNLIFLLLAFFFHSGKK